MKKPFVYRVGWIWMIKFPDYYFPVIQSNCKEVKDRIKQWYTAGGLNEALSYFKG